MPSFLDYLYQWFWGFWIVSYVPLVCFHLFPPNLVFLLLGQCIRHKTQTELKCSFKEWKILHWNFPASGARVYLQSECLEMMGSGFLLFFFFFLTSINVTVFLTVPLVPESEMIGVCRAFGANSPLLVANVAGLNGHALKVIRHPDFLTEIVIYFWNSCYLELFQVSILINRSIASGKEVPY